MRKRLLVAFKRHEIVVVATVISVVFVTAMGWVAWMLRSSIATPPYETMQAGELERIFATGYLRFREDGGSPYLKVELHNGTLWWIKKLEFEFDGNRYALRDSEAFRPLHTGALRCDLKKVPEAVAQIEFDLKILVASGYPPAEVQWERDKRKIAGASKDDKSRN
jgi:nitrate reductase NapE component